MAVRELGVKINFSHGLAKLWQIKEWVVSEAAGAARGVEDHAFDGSISHVCGLAIACSDENTMIASGALRGRNGIEALEEDDIVPNVCVVVGVG